MAKCYVTGLGPKTGNNRSHSLQATRRTWKPNLRSVKAEVDGEVKRISVCAKCLRDGKVKRA